MLTEPAATSDNAVFAIRETRKRVMSRPEATSPATLSEADQRELILAIAERRDRTAFATLFRHFAPRLTAFGMRAGANRETAEELAQEAMIAVWNKAAMFDSRRASVSTWIFTIVRNKRIDLFRRESRPEIDPEEMRLMQEPTPTGEAHVGHRQTQQVLARSIDDLPAEQAELLRRAFYMDQSHSAISKELDLPLGTVKSRIRLALARLRDQVAEIEI